MVSRAIKKNAAYGVLRGRCAVVTGASSGIGKAIALRFAKAEAKVALLARRKERLEGVKARIEEDGAEALVVPADLSDPKEVRRAFDVIRRKWEDPDILVNNAGVGCHGPMVSTTIEDFEKVFNVNVRGLYLATMEVLDAMLKKKSGDIINISSISGKMGMANSALYCASKFAVMGLSEALLEEVREKNVRVTVICPGMVDTEIFGPIARTLFTLMMWPRPRFSRPAAPDPQPSKRSLSVPGDRSLRTG